MSVPLPSRDEPVLFLPGPTQVAREVLAEMARPAIGHRGEEIRALIRDVEDGLQRLLSTDLPVLLFTASATAVMEAAVRNGVGDGGILHLTCGAFGDRWIKVSRACGKEVTVLEAPWGTGFTPEMLERALAERSYDAVAITHNETSTGVLNPLRALADVVRRHDDTLLFVDAVSSMSAVETPFDAWGLDVLLAGVQKAFALPPGLAVAAVSERTYARAESVEGRGMYLDFLPYRKQLESFQTPSTPSTAHLYALRHQLGRIEREGFAERIARHEAMRDRARAWASDRFALFAADDVASPTVTCVEVPEGFDIAALRDQLRTQGWVLGGGYGALKSRTFRIGHMGEHTLESLDALLQAIDAQLAAT